ncbi:NUDIX hydrolase [Desulfonatronum thioautotrophicum]|uniref:NUDIX hydrolase n=1 Tax=Desulfonatronum thioautotrophicum TaxID=617001 RepID=UPI0005EBBB4A|nr:NUDIX hydrolase [Desulfonatronum thioautotrophicum]
MEHDPPTPWLEWSREIQSLSQTGLAFAQTHYERVRYHRLLELASEMVSHRTCLDSDDVLRTFQVQPGYATVKVDVRGAVVRDDRILLVRERTDGRWAMPGGWADVGEYPSDMISREIREESGYEAKPVRLIGVYDANRAGRPMEFFHAYKVIFLCELTGGAPAASDETSDVGFFPFDDLPSLSEHRTNQVHLLEVRRHLADPTRPAAFD